MKLLLFMMMAPALLAQSPRVSNARVETRNGADLKGAMQAITAAQQLPAWVAYSIPATRGQNNNSCCWNDGYRGCALEGQNRMAGTVSTGPVMLEGSSTLIVLYRVENHAVEKMRTVSGDCELDAGGLPFILLTGVKQTDSVDLLESMLTDKKNNQALFAIAMHDEGYTTLKRIALQNSSDNIRDQAMFGLSIRPEPDAVTTLIEAAKNDKSTKVRGQALFWLAHKAGQRETAAIVGAIDNDPELAVKKKAVFALTQIPKDEGVPKLIEVAKSNRSPEVRKQAMFWLGQSKDPRAIEFFRELLSK
jgi:HEAT repeats